MIEIPPDPFDEFFNLPLGLASIDPRFDVRRLHPSEFERAYDCVDAAFGKQRPRAVFDWLYRQNPYGKAQVWVVEERATGRTLKTGARFPWPIWRGNEPVHGYFSGDAATVPEWQRGGLSKVRREVRRSHPWQGKVCTISGPNSSSRIVSRKQGESDKILGQLRGGVVVLKPVGSSGRTSPAAVLASLSSRTAATALAAWRHLLLRRGSDALRFEPLPRFEATIDDVTLRTMRFPGYWCPHGSVFLNWRYLDHPGETYSAFVLREADAVIGYAVLRIAQDGATIAEFAVDVKPPARATTLLLGLLDAARQAGCTRVNFFGTPSWRHWGLFRRAGMLPYPTNNYLEVSYDLDPEGSKDIDNWQLMPGDRDYH